MERELKRAVVKLQRAEDERYWMQSRQSGESRYGKRMYLRTEGSSTTRSFHQA